MARSFDGCIVPDFLDRMPCGGLPVFDNGSGYGYRCEDCGAVIGSMGQSQRCKEINEGYQDKEVKL